MVVIKYVKNKYLDRLSFFNGYQSFLRFVLFVVDLPTGRWIASCHYVNRDADEKKFLVKT